MMPYSRLIASLFALIGAAASNQALAQEQQDCAPGAKTADRCVSVKTARYLQKSVLGEQCDPRKGPLDPERCSQTRLMKEGGNVYAVYQGTAREKLRLAEEEFNPNDSLGTPKPNFSYDAIVDRLSKDGTCLSSDKGKITATDNPCTDRLRRQLADAQARTHNEALRLNSGRRELLSPKGTKVLPEVVPVQAATNQPQDDGKHDTIVKDLNEAVKPPDKKQQLMRLLAVPQEVSFTNGGVGSTLTGGEPLKKAKTIDTTEIDPDQAKRDPDMYIYETADETGAPDKALNAVVAKKRESLKTSFKADDKEYAARAKQEEKAPTKFNSNDESLSAQALKNVVDGLNRAGQEKTGAKALDGAANKQDIKVTISDVKLKPDREKQVKSRTLDEQMVDHLSKIK